MTFTCVYKNYYKEIHISLCNKNLSVVKQFVPVQVSKTGSTPVRGSRSANLANQQASNSQSEGELIDKPNNMDNENENLALRNPAEWIVRIFQAFNLK